MTSQDKKDKSKVRHHRYYLKNRVQILERIEKYHEKNKDERKKYLDGYYQKNKERIKARSRQRRIENKNLYLQRESNRRKSDKYKEISRLWREKSKEKLKEYFRIHDMKRNSQEERKIATRRTYLKKNFGITLEEYNIIFNNQEGCCAGCKKHQSKLKQKLSVDHCHTTGKIRGLLCKLCNLALGNISDDIKTLQNLIGYLSNNSTIHSLKI